MSDLEWGDTRSLRMAAEGVADAIKKRTGTMNRVRSGMADLMVGEQPTKKEIENHPLVQIDLRAENAARDLLQSLYVQNVPLKVREWAASQPILKSGELFPRICGMTGNPRLAIPLRMEGTGKARKAVPDGEPYWRECRCLCDECVLARKDPDEDGGLHCRVRSSACSGLRDFWQWCGCGDPERFPRTAVELKDLGVQVIQVNVEVGDHVEAGDVILSLKAGKGIGDVPSPVTGIVTSIAVQAGSSWVKEGDEICQVSPTDLAEAKEGTGRAILTTEAKAVTTNLATEAKHVTANVHTEAKFGTEQAKVRTEANVLTIPVLVPDLGEFGIIKPQEYLLSMGKRTTVRPLLRAFSNQLLMNSARSQDIKDSELFKIFTEARTAAEAKVHARTCRNKKVPPLSPNGCGTSAHPEWGAVGSPWRAGHMNAHAHRVTQKEMLRMFWEAAEGTY